MGRTHSNAFLQAPRFFDLPYKPVLKAVCARSVERVRGFAENWDYQTIQTDWRTLVERKDIDLIDIASPNDTHAEIAIAAAKAGKMVLCEKPLGRTAAEAKGMVDAVKSANVPNMVLLPIDLGAPGLLEPTELSVQVLPRGADPCVSVCRHVALRCSDGVDGITQGRSVKGLCYEISQLTHGLSP